MTMDDTDVINPAGFFVATTHRADSGDGMQSDYDNAAFIVRACNAHDDLLAALRYIASRVPSHRDDNLRPLVADLQETALHAIAKAESC